MTNQSGRTTGNKKVWILAGGVMVAVALIVYFQLFFPPPEDEVAGTIGAVQKHRAEQIDESGVILGEEAGGAVSVAFADLLDDVARRLHAQGVIGDPHADLPFPSRYPRILSEYPQLYKFLNISLPLLNEEADPSDWNMHVGLTV